MGILDKARTQAQQIAQKAQEGAKGAQDKLEDLQAKKRADALLRELGAWHHAQHEGRDHGRAAGEIARIHGALRAHETEHGALPLPTDTEPSATSSAPEPSATSSAPEPSATSSAPEPSATSSAPEPSATSPASSPSATSPGTGTPLPETTHVPPTGATQAGALRTPVEGRGPTGGTA